jgi:hypothetical protein
MQQLCDVRDNCASLRDAICENILWANSEEVQVHIMFLQSLDTTCFKIVYQHSLTDAEEPLDRYHHYAEADQNLNVINTEKFCWEITFCDKVLLCAKCSLNSE